MSTRRAATRSRRPVGRCNARRPIGPAEEVALHKLRNLGGSGSADFISSEDLPKFGTSVAEFDKALEKHVVARGWFGEAPSKAISRWAGRGTLAIIGGVIALIIGFNVPISGLTLIGGAAVLAGILLIIIAQAMPAVTLNGAMIRAMLAAYRRTLEKTMAQARSMQQVVDEAGLDWLETPDQAVVWGTALGLQGRIEDVLQRSLEDVKQDGTERLGHLVPGLVPVEQRRGLRERGGRHGERREHLLGLGHPRHRRDDGRARHDRELAVVVRQLAAAAASRAVARAVAGAAPAAASRRGVAARSRAPRPRRSRRRTGRGSRRAPRS